MKGLAPIKRIFFILLKILLTVPESNNTVSDSSAIRLKKLEN